jgi:hypothetical protein
VGEEQCDAGVHADFSAGKIGAAVDIHRVNFDGPLRREHAQ